MNTILAIKTAAFTYCSENKYKIGAILSVALLALALGVEIGELSLPKPDLPNKETFSILQQRHTALSLPSIMSVYVTLPLFVVSVALWGIKYYKQPTVTESRGKAVLRTAVLLGGLALVFAGLGMVTTSAFNQTHSTFAENNTWYSDKRWACLQDTLSANMAGGVSMMVLGGIVFAGGISLELTNQLLGYVVQSIRSLWAKRTLEQYKTQNPEEL